MTASDSAGSQTSQPGGAHLRARDAEKLRIGLDAGAAPRSDPAPSVSPDASPATSADPQRRRHGRLR